MTIGHAIALQPTMQLSFLLAFSTSLFAQSVEVGVVGGIPLTHDFSTYTLNLSGSPGPCGSCATQLTLPYVVGPAVQVHLWRPLYFDAQALYSHAHYMLDFSLPGENLLQGTDHHVDRWEFPLLLKMRLPAWHQVSPFFAAGVSFQYNHDFQIIVPLPGVTSGTGRIVDSAIGPAFAAGASFGSHWIRPTVEVRYTRWAEPAINASLNAGITLRSKQDEAQVLVGLMFGAGRSQPGSSGVLEGPLSRRRVSVGMKGGLLFNEFSTRENIGNTYPFTHCFDCGTARSPPYIFGPALEVRIVGGLSTTAEALYSRADYDHTSFISELSSGFLDSEEKHAVDRWEAPLLLKYAFKMRALTPFISAGASIQYDRERRVQALYAQYCFTCSGRNGLDPGVSKITLDHTTGPPIGSLVVGPTAGTGASFSVGRIRPSIEARYTYWLDRPIAVYPPPPQLVLPVPVYQPTIASSHSQIQLLVGIMF